MFNIDSETASTSQMSSDLSTNRQTPNISSYRVDTLESDEDEDDIFSRRARSQRIKLRADYDVVVIDPSERLKDQFLGERCQDNFYY